MCKFVQIERNKLETFEDAIFESGNTSTHKTERKNLHTDLAPRGERNAEKINIWQLLNICLVLEICLVLGICPLA